MTSRRATTSATAFPGTVTKITNFGVFVELEAGLEGLLHISELADHKVDNPEDVVNVGQKVEVRVIKIDPEERKIGLTLIQAHFDVEEEGAETEARPAPTPTPALGTLATQLKDLGQRMSEREATDDPVEPTAEAEAPAEAPAEAAAEAAPEAPAEAATDEADETKNAESQGGES